MIYIEGYALITSLGKSAKASVSALREENIKPISKPLFMDGIKYYKILDSKPLDYYDQIEQVAKSAISHANINPKEIENMALFIGTSSAKLPLNEYYAQESGELLKDLYMSEVSEIIAKKLGIKGFRTIISTACTSSANALIQAKEMIESGLIKKALVVGVELYNQLTLKGFDSFMLLTKTEMKPFDKDRDGIILGEALSAVVLGHNPSQFGLVGGAVTVDTSSITAPHHNNLKEVMSQALKNANIHPHEIELIKAHATASIQNDISEAKAINLLFSKKVPPVLPLKPYIGHTMGACGTNELVLFLESLKEGFIPKAIHFENRDEACALTPNLEELEAKKGYYLLNYFGFGGNNSSLVMHYNKGV